MSAPYITTKGQRQLTVFCLSGAFCALLAGCSGYDLTVNDAVVYTPRPLFRDYELADAALAACVEQHIIDARITRSDQLEQLNCSAAGISDLDGLAAFGNLRQLKLSDNAIRNLSAIGSLAQLRGLYLDGNALLDIGIVRGFPLLQALDVSDNPALICPAPGQYPWLDGLTLPDHCRD